MINGSPYVSFDKPIGCELQIAKFSMVILFTTENLSAVKIHSKTTNWILFFLCQRRNHSKEVVVNIINILFLYRISS